MGMKRGLYRIDPHMTDKRREFLIDLMKGPRERPSNVVGWQCHQLKWVEWNWVVKETGEQISLSEAGARWPKQEMWERIAARGARITELGRKVLNDHLEGR